MIYVDRNSLNIPFSERVIGHYGDNSVNTLTFEIGDSVAAEEYILYIAFSDGSINSILLDKDEDNNAIWSVESNHIFTAGIAYIQIKAIGENGEIWHSPKAVVEFLHSIDENNPTGEHIPSLFEKLDEKISEILNDPTKGNDYITRTDAAELIAASIDELLLPLSQRLDGE